MVKKILSFFGYKVFTKSEYEELLSRIAKVSNYYRSLTMEGSYHHYDTKVNVPLRKLGDICLVENLVWDDIKVMIHKEEIA